MTFDEILAQVIALLQREKRVSYRALQRRFNILVPAHRTLGTTLVHFGEFTAARAHLEQDLTLYDPQQHRQLASLWPATSRRNPWSCAPP